MSQTKAQLVGGVGISTVGDLSVYGGVNVSGVVTATSFIGPLTGNVTGNATGLSGIPNLNVGIVTASSFIGPLTGNVTGNATGLSGIPNLNVGIVTASSFYGGSATITGNVSIGGTLTYEDVTNVDSVGLITARSGIRVTGGTVVVGSGVTVSSGGINVVGIVTATTLSKTTLADYADKINALGNTGTSATVDLSNGNFVTGTLTGDCTFTFTTGIGTGAQAFTLFLTNDATPSRTITWPVTVKWPGGSVPVRTETANKTDVYSFFTYDNGSNWYGTLSIYNYS